MLSRRDSNLLFLSSSYQLSLMTDSTFHGFLFIYEFFFHAMKQQIRPIFFKSGDFLKLRRI